MHSRTSMPSPLECRTAWGTRTTLGLVRVVRRHALTCSIPAVIITRGLAEMARIGTAYGASPLTFLGLAGVGDLFLTCSSSNSRNYTVGYRLGQGESLDEIVKTLGSVAEGVSTAKGAKAIVDQMKVSAPIAESVSVCAVQSNPSNMRYQIYEVLYNGAHDRLLTPEMKLTMLFAGLGVKDAIRYLMELPPSKELDLPKAPHGPASRLLKKLGLDE